MRINKTTSDYIKSLVRAKAQPKVDALNASLANANEKDTTLRNEYCAEIQKLQEKANAEAKKIAKKFKIDPFHYINWRGEQSEQNPEADFDEFTGKSIITPLKTEIDKIQAQIEELNNKIEQKCTEVIARLSLGGTAEDLDRLIAELKF